MHVIYIKVCIIVLYFQKNMFKDISQICEGFLDWMSDTSMKDNICDLREGWGVYPLIFTLFGLTVAYKVELK